MSELRERIHRAAYRGYCSQEQGDWSAAYDAAACEALRHAKQRMFYFENDEYRVKAQSEIDTLLTEIETGSRVETEDVGGVSPTEVATGPCLVPAPELPHDDRERCRCGRIKDSIWHYFTEQPGPDDLGAHRYEPATPSR